MRIEIHQNSPYVTVFLEDRNDCVVDSGDRIHRTPLECVAFRQRQLTLWRSLWVGWRKGDLHLMTTIRRITDGKQHCLQRIGHRFHTVPTVILEIFEDASVVGIGQILYNRKTPILRVIPSTLQNRGVPAEQGGPERIHGASCIDEVSFHNSQKHTAYFLNKLIFPLQ